VATTRLSAYDDLHERVRALLVVDGDALHEDVDVDDGLFVA
jgi:hypothetical protein